MFEVFLDFRGGGRSADQLGRQQERRNQQLRKARFHRYCIKHTPSCRRLRRILECADHRRQDAHTSAFCIQHGAKAIGFSEFGACSAAVPVLFQEVGFTHKQAGRQAFPIPLVGAGGSTRTLEPCRRRSKPGKVESHKWGRAKGCELRGLPNVEYPVVLHGFSA